MEWISVKDRLPELQLSVLLYKESVGGYKWFEVGYLNSYTTSVNRIYPEWVVNGKYGESEYSHWMPLPEPPKQ